MIDSVIRRKVVQHKHDLTGRRFGMWEVLAHRPKGRKCRHWECRCDCGVVKVVSGDNLKAGLSVNCGCQRKIKMLGNTISLIHGRRSGGRLSPEYTTWNSLKRRCSNLHEKAYKNYGGRGIKVCDRWLRGTKELSAFECFLQDMGPRPSPELSIDRINNDGNYEPSNCRWATVMEQANNRRAPRREGRQIVFKGESRNISEWERLLGLPAGLVCKRVYKGWTDEEALSTPLPRRS